METETKKLLDNNEFALLMDQKTRGIAPGELDIHKKLIQAAAKKNAIKWLGFEANGVRSNPRAVQKRRITSYLTWMKEFARELQHLGIPTTGLEDECRLMIYAKTSKDQRWEGIYMKYGARAILISSTRKLTKKVQKFLQENFDEFSFSSYVIVLKSTADANLFRLKFDGTSDSHNFVTSDLSTHSNNIDQLINECLEAI